MLRWMEKMGEWLKRFRTREMKSDSPVLRQLSTTCFVLAGFSLTSLALFISFYRWQLPEVGNKISVLLICSIFLLLAGEFSREATKVWEYISAELLYLSSIVLLLTVFLTFVVTLPEIHPIAVVIIILGILFFLAKTVWDIHIAYRTNPQPTALLSCMRFE
jgi:hypothetical protein